MKNRFIIFTFLLLINTNLFAENVFIESKKISLDKNKAITVFEDEVVVKTEDKITIKSDYGEYDKKLGIINLRKNIIATDNKNNIIKTDFAIYDENKKILKSIGPTEILTSEKYKVLGSDIIFNNNDNLISSNKDALITDLSNNKISLKNFQYLTQKNIFKSIGFIKIQDEINNNYEFSQLYVDTQKKEILGTDVRAYMNNEEFKINKKNKPRIFANTLKISDDKSSFNKSNFTICDYRKNDKCPPWSIQAKKMLHDNKKKTIYYNNAIVKVYNIPIFFLPKLSHPDPTVSRRSGFLTPTFSDSKNLGAGLSIPYFAALSNDKNFTLTNKLYADENPLFSGEYHQVFKNSVLFTDFGYTEGYKKNSVKKKSGHKSHIFSKFIKNYKQSENSESTLSLSLQDVSNDKYLKLYKVDSSLIDNSTSTIENSLDFVHENENFFLGLNASIYETLNDKYNDKYEYILPEIVIGKNLINNNTIGNIDLVTNYKVHNYDTNKLTNFLINDFDWNYKEIDYNSGFRGKILGNIKNINYEAKNIDIYKNESTSELYGALGYLLEADFQKIKGDTDHKLTPKFLVRYAPGSMRKELSGSRLDPINAFSLNRLNNINNFETGLSSTVGFDYKIKNNDRSFDFSVAQIINEMENKKMSSKSSLDEKLSDVVGSANYEIGKNINLKYNFSLDQNYKQLNYDEIGTTFDFNPIKIDFNYLKESKHIGDQEYFGSRIDFAKSDNGLFTFETKRNLVTDSSEFYNLSYEYINDCLRAGLVYRREFYTDSEIEPENSLMFKITLTPFGNINSPSFTQ